MSLLFWKRRERPDTDDSHEGALAVDEQHALPVGLYFKSEGSEEAEVVGDDHPLPVAIQSERAAVPSYRAAFSFSAVAGDALVIFGRAQMKIGVLEIAIAKPSVTQTVLVNKRTTNTSGGTSTLATNVANDPAAPRSGAIVRLYTAAPTAGTLDGTVARCVVATTDLLVLDFRAEPITMRTAEECLAVNVDATGTLPGWILWTEQPL